MRQKRHYEYVIPVFGLDSSGKTTLFKRLRRDYSSWSQPTMGFNPHRVTVVRTTVIKRWICCKPKYRPHFEDIIMYDIGGGPKIRGIWKNYTAEAHGFVLVVNASETNRYQEFVKEIGALVKLEDERCLRHKPILIFFNITQDDDLKKLAEFKQLIQEANWPYVITENCDETDTNLSTIIVQPVQLANHMVPGKTETGSSGSKNKVGPVVDGPTTVEGIDPRIHDGILCLLDRIDINKDQIDTVRRDQMLKLDERYKKELAEKKIKFQDGQPKLSTPPIKATAEIEPSSPVDDAQKSTAPVKTEGKQDEKITKDEAEGKDSPVKEKKPPAKKGVKDTKKNRI